MKIDMTGKTIGKWTVLREDPGLKGGSREVRWICRCSCGREQSVLGSTLRFGNSKGCKFCKSISHGEIVGGRESKEYRIWNAARGRCFNINHASYKDYGGRGISMCKEWRYSFSSFLKHIGRCPTGYVLDRIENNGNYEPGNVRWTTPSISRNNQRLRKPYGKRSHIKAVQMHGKDAQIIPRY